MNYTQVATLINSITSEKLGSSAILEDNLANVVDVGEQILNNLSYDAFCSALVDRITKVIFVDRKYTGAMATLRREDWEYGIKQKIYLTELPVAVDDETYQLSNGTSYDDNKFTSSAVAAKFYQNTDAFRVDISIADKQVKTAFASAGELNSFISMVLNGVDTAIELRLEGLASSVVSTLIGNIIYDDIPDLDLSKTGVKAVNLLKLYNDQFDPNGADPLTVDEALFTPEFIRFAVLIISQYQERLKRASTLFNCGGLVRHTPAAKQKLLLLANLKNAADVYLQSDTFNEQYTALPGSETIAYWQGSGTDYGFDSVSKIHVDIKDPSDGTKTVEVEASGILGVLFDYDAAGIDCEERTVTEHRNASAQFTNLFYHQSARYWIDLNESAVVFFIGEKAGE